MLSFECDYNNGAHPKVLQHLIDTNITQSLTYGFDEWTESAKKKIRLACQAPDADIFFLAGGTQANATVIDSMLATCEAVIAADTAHINVHEAGAVEASGHRIIALPNHDGKMSADDLQAFMEQFENDESRDHLAQPGMVYITFPTEYGTVYQAEEISRIRNICRQYHLKLFIDGARLGYGLMADKGDDFQANRDHRRPLIIAGFSQGGLAVVELLKHMDDATYSQLAAAYVLGYKVTPADTLQSPHIKAARGEADTGVTICYNTVKDVKYIKPVVASTCMGINPVNWHTDATPATLHDTITVVLSTDFHVLVVSGYSGSEYKPYKDLLNVGDIHSCEPWLYSECLQRNFAVRASQWRRAHSADS